MFSQTNWLFVYVRSRSRASDPRQTLNACIRCVSFRMRKVPLRGYPAKSFYAERKFCGDRCSVVFLGCASVGRGSVCPCFVGPGLYVSCFCSTTKHEARRPDRATTVRPRVQLHTRLSLGWMLQAAPAAVIPPAATRRLSCVAHDPSQGPEDISPNFSPGS